MGKITVFLISIMTICIALPNRTNAACPNVGCPSSQHNFCGSCIASGSSCLTPLNTARISCVNASHAATDSGCMALLNHNCWFKTTTNGNTTAIYNDTIICWKNGDTNCKITITFNNNTTSITTTNCNNGTHPEFDTECKIYTEDNTRPCSSFGNQPTFNFLGATLENHNNATWNTSNASWNISNCKTFSTQYNVSDQDYHCTRAFSSVTVPATLTGHIGLALQNFSITYNTSGITPPHYCEQNGCEQYYTAELVSGGPNGAYTCVQDNTNNCTSGFDFDWATQSCNVNDTEYTDKTGTFTLNSGTYENSTTDYLNDSICSTGN